MSIALHSLSSQSGSFNFLVSESHGEQAHAALLFLARNFNAAIITEGYGGQIREEISSCTRVSPGRRLKDAMNPLAEQKGLNLLLFCEVCKITSCVPPEIKNLKMLFTDYTPALH